MPELVLILIRSIVAFVLLLLMARIMGKKQISQLTFFDYCVGITIGSIAATMSVDQNVKAINGMLALLVWGLFPIILAYVSLKSMWFTKMIDGSPTILIQNGEILEKNLKKNLVTADELMLLLREKGVFKVSDVEMAVLETNGQLSVMLNSNQQPLTPHKIGISLEKEHGPTILIMDGILLDRGLKERGHTKEWLLSEIQKQGAKDFKEVFLAQIDSQGNIYVDLYKDQAKRYITEERQPLGETLKKIQADLEHFSLQTDNPEAKKVYEKEATNLQKTIDSIFPYLK
ncbi:DUF421 domain-containing protein [Bacillus sinesaloumensis]|uniref:DUF421 domain-containing protein n=1 Tax=Litchfieldia sinesaloumensis TaxID=1926280 RepID=UPI0009886744|nr:DUF421 domain-containing protein [Bacillus sinesaloumensis]